MAFDKEHMCRSIKVLPLVYDEALSYYEQVCKLYDAYNDFVDKVTESISNFNDESKAYTDNKVAEAFADIQAQSDALRKDYEQFVTLVNSNINLFQTQLDTTSAKLEAEIIGVNARTDVAIEQSEERILTYIGSQALNNIKVLDPFSGNYVTIQYMIEYLSSLHMTGAATYDEIFGANISYDEIVAKDKTYTEWATNGHEYIM
nr:MAG TPA: hypothetical protein [Caudoviricetes sp.]